MFVVVMIAFVIVVVGWLLLFFGSFGTLFKRRGNKSNVLVSLMRSVFALLFFVVICFVVVVVVASVVLAIALVCFVGCRLLL